MKKIIFLLPILLLTMWSCHEDSYFEENEKINTEQQYHKKGAGDTDFVKQSIIELVELQKNISNYKEALQEVYLLAQNKLYKDNYVFLNDLLNPSQTKIYQDVKLPNGLSGSFKKAMEEELKSNPDKYPILIEFIKRTPNLTSDKVDLNTFYTDCDISFYIPYITDDNERIIDLYEHTTFVPGIEDVDKALGYQRNGNLFKEVMTDDDYANDNLTIIFEPNYGSCTIQPYDPEVGGVGSGGNYPNVVQNTYDGNCADLADGTYVREVKWGDTKLNKQYDNWISFTGNGGGSEIMLCRLGIDAPNIEPDGNFSLTGWTNIHQVYFSRKGIRKRDWKWVASNWDTNWECNPVSDEQIMCVWEQDTEGNVQASGNFTVWDQEIFNFDFNIGNRSKDQLIHLDAWDVNWFFSTVFLDQGCGFKNGKYSFNRPWPIRECGTDFEYTMIYRWVEY